MSCVCVVQILIKKAHERLASTTDKIKLEEKRKIFTPINLKKELQ